MKKFLLLTLSAAFLSAEPLLLGCAGGYKKPMSQIIELAKTEGIDVEAIYGHPKSILAQSSASDIALIIGDEAFLKVQNLVKIYKFTPLGKGELVFVTSNDKLKKEVDISSPAMCEKIAIPQPQKTIYGKAASEYIKNSRKKSWDEIKILEVAGVPAVSAYLKSGDVKCGFVNRTEAIALGDKFHSIKLSQNLYSPIIIGAGELAKCQNSESCAKFIKLLNSNKAKAIFEKFGLK